MKIKIIFKLAFLLVVSLSQSDAMNRPTVKRATAEQQRIFKDLCTTMGQSSDETFRSKLESLVGYDLYNSAIRVRNEFKVASSLSHKVLEIIHNAKDVQYVVDIVVFEELVQKLKSIDRKQYEHCMATLDGTQLDACYKNFLRGKVVSSESSQPSDTQVNDQTPIAVLYNMLVELRKTNSMQHLCVWEKFPQARIPELSKFFVVQNYLLRDKALAEALTAFDTYFPGLSTFVPDVFGFLVSLDGKNKDCVEQALSDLEQVNLRQYKFIRDVLKELV